MRIACLILLTWLGLFQVMFGAGASKAFGGSLDSMSQTTALTNIAGCLDQVRNHPDQARLVKLEAGITLFDPERNLIILQDDSAAMAVYAPLAKMSLKPGQRVMIEGSGIFPCVRAFPDFPDHPSERGVLNSFEAPSGQGIYFLNRFRGWLHPPVSGQYTFWMAADDAGELWLSTNVFPTGRQKIASNKIGNATHAREWDRNPSQHSKPVMLKAGEAYYVEALHVQSYGTDCFTAAWAGPGIERSVIQGRYLTPFTGPSSAGAQLSAAPSPATGLLWECWTNFFVNDYEPLHAQNRNETMVRIHDLKMTLAGEGQFPTPEQIEGDVNLAAIPSLHWVELEGDVNFAGETGGELRIELKREDSILEVRVLNWDGSSPERLVNSHVRIQGVLEHGYGPNGELTGNVLWVPDARRVSLVSSEDNQQANLSRVSIGEIEPSNPQMNWGRRVSVHGRIINQTTNGLLVVQGADNYQAFCSADGTNWVSLGEPVEIGMSNSILIGLALASHATTNAATARFDHLQGFGTNWQGADIGKPGLAGQFNTDGGTLTLRGSGKQLRARSDQGYFVYQPLEGEAELCAQLTDLKKIDLHTQAGLMIRESLNRKSPCAIVFFSPASGPVFQYRPTYGDISVGFEPKPDHRQFRWLKLIRRKSLLLVQGEPGPEIDTNQEVEIAGLVTWNKGVPILTKASFQLAGKESTPNLSPVLQPPPVLSIANFIFEVQHPPEPYLFKSMHASNLCGVITFCGDVLGKNVVFVQGGDAGGVQMNWPDAAMMPKLEVGQSVQMSGISPVHRWPILFESTSFKVMGWGTLPEPVGYSSVLIKSGSGQGRWVEADGVVRSVETNGLLNLMTSDGPLAVWIGHGSQTNAGQYVDAWLRLRGVLSLDSAQSARLLVPSAGFMEMLERPPADQFATPTFSIAELAALDVKPDRLRKMKMSGVVTFALPGGIYVQDRTGGAYAETSETAGLLNGDRVEVAGFPEYHLNAMTLWDASVRKLSGGEPPNPVHITGDVLDDMRHACVLVGLEGTLLDQRTTWWGQVLTLKAGTKIFEAMLTDDHASHLPGFAIGSRLALTGICRVSHLSAPPGPQAESIPALATVNILLRTPADVIVLERPPWWTAKRVAWFGVICACGLLGALAWVRMLRRRVALRTRELQAAMARLEQETRTSAVLAERDRLAGEIHDSLEQGLTAIMLQLDAANRQTDQSSAADKHLRMARNMAEFSRAEVQHAVWDMQSPLLENADLGTALRHVANQIGSGTPEVRVEITGVSHALPSRHEHHLLRIAQEAITNAIKHSQARSVVVRLDYSGTDLRLTITDDGKGFIPGEVKLPGQSGHFGLQGIRARAKKIGAQMHIDSGAGVGAVITVQMKLNGEANGAANGKHQ